MQKVTVTLLVCVLAVVLVPQNVEGKWGRIGRFFGRVKEYGRKKTSALREWTGKKVTNFKTKFNNFKVAKKAKFDKWREGRRNQFNGWKDKYNTWKGDKALKWKNWKQKFSNRRHGDKKPAPPKKTPEAPEAPKKTPGVPEAPKAPETPAVTAPRKVGSGFAGLVERRTGLKVDANLNKNNGFAHVVVAANPKKGFSKMKVLKNILSGGSGFLGGITAIASAFTGVAQMAQMVKSMACGKFMDPYAKSTCVNKAKTDCESLKMDQDKSCNTPKLRGACTATVTAETKEQIEEITSTCCVTCKKARADKKKADEEAKKKAAEQAECVRTGRKTGRCKPSKPRCEDDDKRCPEMAAYGLCTEVISEGITPEEVRKDCCKSCAEAKKKAEEEAKRKAKEAEEEAKRKAREAEEEKARKKAAEEARKKAEEEAKRKAAEQAAACVDNDAQCEGIAQAGGCTIENLYSYSMAQIRAVCCASCRTMGVTRKRDVSLRMLGKVVEEILRML